MLHVENLTRKTVLVEKGRMAKNAWLRFRGLMGLRQLPIGEGLLIQPCDSVHTHFMRIAIDVLYINDQHEIIHIDAGLKPWRIARRQRAARAVLELPEGVAAQTGTQIGDRLLIRI